jgi:hypothetical protein
MNRHDIQFLRSQQKYPSISIFVRTHRAMPEREKDPIAVKNLIQEAKERLLKEFTQREVQDVLDNLDFIARTIDYSQTLDGLAIFVNAYIRQMFYLPLAVENKVIIDDLFEIREIIRLLSKMPRYWVLVLSEKPTRLFQGVGKTLSEVIEPENDVMGVSRDGFPLTYTKPEVEVQGYSMRGNTVRHGHEDSRYFDDHKRVFFGKIDRLLARFTVVEPLPLIVVGVEHNLRLFKDAARHARIAEQILGDYAEAPLKVLEPAVWEAIQKLAAQEVAEKLKELDEATGHLRSAVGIEAVWRTAVEGRIKDLLVEEDYVVSGKINPNNEANLILYDDPKAPGISDDLINHLIDIVIDMGGGHIVFCKPGTLKEQGKIAAILRY